MDKARTIEVCTGSRLHFGLTSVSNGSPNHCSGMGVMIEQPETRIVVSRSKEFAVSGSQRAVEFANRWCSTGRRRLSKMACRIDVQRAPSLHVGLGSGTQLALAVGMGLELFFDGDNADPVAMTARMKRGARSAIGTYGFAHGGLIVDEPSGNALPPGLAMSRPVPENWRLLLVRLTQVAGRHGNSEKQAFAMLADAHNKHASIMDELIRNHVVPAVDTGAFDRFAEAIDQYGQLAGDYYRSVQGGTYNGGETAAVVHSIRQLGIKGVGQSSWGPVVFAWCCDESEAKCLQAAVAKRWQHCAEIWISRVRNRGATFNHHNDMYQSTTKRLFECQNLE